MQWAFHSNSSRLWHQQGSGKACLDGAAFHLYLNRHRSKEVKLAGEQHPSIDPSSPVMCLAGSVPQPGWSLAGGEVSAYTAKLDREWRASSRGIERIRGLHALLSSQIPSIFCTVRLLQPAFPAAWTKVELQPVLLYRNESLPSARTSLSPACLHSSSLEEWIYSALTDFSDTVFCLARDKWVCSEGESNLTAIFHVYQPQ